MAEFRVVSTSDPLTRNGVQGELTATVDGREVMVILTWSPEAGVTEWWVIEETGTLDVSWAMNPALAVLAAQAVVESHGDVQDTSFEWSPPVEWGVAWGRDRDGRPSAVESMRGDDVFPEKVARLAAKHAGRDVVARIAAGPWTVVPEQSDE